MADSKGSDKEDEKSEISEKNINDSLEYYKVTNTHIIGIVHHYFCIFHSWLPGDEDIKGKFIFKLIKLLFCSTLMYFLLFTLNNATKIFIDFDVTLFLLISTVISWLFQIVALFIGFLLLSPKKIETIQNRMKAELNIDTSHLANLKSKNFFVARFELEKIWLEIVLTDNNIEGLIEKVESNINNRKPSTRDIDSIIFSIVKNPILISFTAGILVAFVTLFSKVITSSTEKLVTNVNSVGATLFLIWLTVILIILGTKTLFMTFVWSIENSTKNKILVIWRYEIFRDMLARHQTVIIRKPRIRYVPVLESKKEQEKIENESEVKVVIDIAEKVESINNR